MILSLSKDFSPRLFQIVTPIHLYRIASRKERIIDSRRISLLCLFFSKTPHNIYNTMALNCQELHFF